MCSGLCLCGGADDVVTVWLDSRLHFFLLHTLSPARLPIMVNSLWFKWKSLRLPWRKSFMVGQFLSRCARMPQPSLTRHQARTSQETPFGNSRISQTPIDSVAS